MTPKLRLSEEARKALLSWIRKDFWLGNRRTRVSTQMIVAPKQQAELGSVAGAPEGGCRRTKSGDDGQSPPAGVTVQTGPGHGRAELKVQEVQEVVRLLGVVWRAVDGLRVAIEEGSTTPTMGRWSRQW